MTKTFILGAVLILLAGCASLSTNEPSASYGLRNQNQCLRDGGVWHENLGICERCGGGM